MTCAVILIGKSELSSSLPQSTNISQTRLKWMNTDYQTTHTQHISSRLLLTTTCQLCTDVNCTLSTWTESSTTIIWLRCCAWCSVCSTHLARRLCQQQYKYANDWLTKSHFPMSCCRSCALNMAGLRRCIDFWRWPMTLTFNPGKLWPRLMINKPQNSSSKYPDGQTYRRYRRLTRLVIKLQFLGGPKLQSSRSENLQ